MHCPRCHRELARQVAFCPGCGAPIALSDELPVRPLDASIDLDRRDTSPGERPTVTGLVAPLASEPEPESEPQFEPQFESEPAYDHAALNRSHWNLGAPPPEAALEGPSLGAEPTPRPHAPEPGRPLSTRAPADQKTPPVLRGPPEAKRPAETRAAPEARRAAEQRRAPPSPQPDAPRSAKEAARPAEAVPPPRPARHAEPAGDTVQPPRSAKHAEPAAETVASPRPTKHAERAAEAVASPRPTKHAEPAAEAVASPRPTKHAEPAAETVASPRPAARAEPRPAGAGTAGAREIHVARPATWRRVVAWAIDGGPFVAAAFALVRRFLREAAAGPSAPVVGLDGLLDLLARERVIVLSVAAAAALALGVYSTLAHALAGATLGKRLLGLRVVGPDGSRPSLARSAGRTALGALSGALLGLGILLALFTRSGRGLHDYLARTWVVEAP